MIGSYSHRGGGRSVPKKDVLANPVTRSQKALCIALASAIVVAFFIPLPFRTPLWQTLFDASHVVLFLVFTWLVLAVLPVRGRSRYAYAALLSAIIAVGVEIIQPVFSRTTSWFDAVAALVGIALGVLGAFVWRRGREVRWRAAHAVVTVVLCAPVFWPVWQQVQALSWRATHFPILGDFEDEVEAELWALTADTDGAKVRLATSSKWASRGKRSLEIRTRTATWAGVSFRAGGADWGAFKRLAVDVFNPGGPFQLNIRIDDTLERRPYAERFNRRIAVHQGHNAITIDLADIRKGPRDRELNTKHIARVVLFTGRNEPGRVFFLDHMRLE